MIGLLLLLPPRWLGGRLSGWWLRHVRLLQLGRTAPLDPITDVFALLSCSPLARSLASTCLLLPRHPQTAQLLFAEP